MSNSQNILIYHPAAIGDSVLATPVAVTLKKQFPEAAITYITHSSLFPLLSLCSAIDNFVSFNKKDSIFQTRALINSLKPDLIVDLSGSTKSFLQTFKLAKKIVRYKKQPGATQPIQHAVHNFLESIATLGLSAKNSYFPTLEAKTSDKEKVQALLRTKNKNYVALVPGVGSLRPHRAWTSEGFHELGKLFLKAQDCTILLIGGKEDQKLCSQLQEQLGADCINLSGQLNLAETAAALSLCSATVSGDTGPAHISVAVGTPVIGIYGPTYAERSGAFGMDQYCLSASNFCHCQNLKSCQYNPKCDSGDCGSGKCMLNITAEQIYAKFLGLSTH